MSRYSWTLCSFCCFLFCCQSPGKEKAITDPIQVNAFVSLLEYDLESLEEEIQELAVFTESLFKEKEKWLAKADPDRFLIENNMANTAPNQDPEFSSIYISTLSTNPKAIRELVKFTHPLDEKFKAIVNDHDVVTQVYYNSVLQVNRLYPPYDVAAMLEPDLDLTSFNFFYQADEKNNPGRGSVWVDEIYIDPVGKGWMMSLLHPVYVEDKLEMVLGFDITVNDIIQFYLDKTTEQLVIIDGEGTLVAGKSKAIEALSLPPLKNHTYLQTITADSFRIEDFNLFKSKSQEVRKMASHFILSKGKYYLLDEGTEKIHITGRKMNKFNWYILDLDL
ncbi:Cache sensor protein [Pararhodonellum marinum]|uniref:Cache sensor protein n=1 Tax=Pararhodonellum marinum TaxID=2755358 RepID=UPI001E2C8890|nr:Cache sensor protein [Pararhodonellum marinum]